jgi:hypothetical protein
MKYLQRGGVNEINDIFHIMKLSSRILGDLPVDLPVDPL